MTLSTQDNAKLPQQLKSGFKTTISWNKYLSKTELLTRNPNLNHLVEPSFQGVNRTFVLAFEDETQRTSNKKYYLPNVGIKDYNVMIDGKNFLDQPVKDSLNVKLSNSQLNKLKSAIKNETDVVLNMIGNQMKLISLINYC